MRKFRHSSNLLKWKKREFYINGSKWDTRKIKSFISWSTWWGQFASSYSWKRRKLRFWTFLRTLAFWRKDVKDAKKYDYTPF